MYSTILWSAWASSVLSEQWFQRWKLLQGRESAIALMLAVADSILFLYVQMLVVAEDEGVTLDQANPSDVLAFCLHEAKSDVLLLCDETSEAICDVERFSLWHNVFWLYWLAYLLSRFGVAPSVIMW